MSETQVVLGLTAVLAGVTGAWSPCGFSMVDTLAGAGRERGRGVLAPSCATFAFGALGGGALLFGGLALLGAALGLGGEAAAQAAAVAAAAAALGELAGARIRPQIRRQVPERWRRTLPLLLAAGLYGLLLGVGFATFVLTLAVLALAVASLASGNLGLGLVIGFAFGLGRALPVVVLAPVAERPLGLRALELMAEHPGSLRGLRALDGLALVACALVVAPGFAAAATRVAAPASDPSVAGGAVAWDTPEGGVLLRAGQRTPLPGRAPALGGGHLAWREGDLVRIVDALTLAPLLERQVPGVSKLAVSARWLAWRARRRGGDAIGAVRLGPGARPRRVAFARAPAQLGRPDLDGDRLVYSRASPAGSAIQEVNLGRGRRHRRARSRTAQLLAPSILGHALLFVRISRCGQRVVLRRRGRPRVLMRRGPLAGSDAGFEPGHTSQGSGYGPCPYRRRAGSLLWSTALARRFAYVTAIRPGAAFAGSRLLRTTWRAARAPTRRRPPPG